MQTLALDDALQPVFQPLVELASMTGLPFSQGHPGLVYLTSLAAGPGRETMRSALRNLSFLMYHPDFTTAPWQFLRYPHVVGLRARLLEQEYAPATVNRHLAALRGVVRESWRLGYLVADEYQRMADLAGVGGSRNLAGRALSFSELEALFQACADGTPVGHRDAALVALLFTAGLRRAEAAALAFADFDPVTSTLRVIGKGDRERSVPVRGGGRAALLSWVGVRGLLPGPLLCRVLPGGLVISDCGITADSLRLRLKYRSRLAGLHSCSPHDLRRTFVTRLLDRGVDLAVVAPHGGTSSGSDNSPVRSAQRAGIGGGRGGA